MKMGGSAFFASLGLMTIAACSSGSNSLVADGGKTNVSCSPQQQVGDQGLKSCAGCTSMTSCTGQAPLEACCTWAAEPDAALARATNLHRYSAPAGDATPSLSCLSSPGTLGTPKMVTLQGYVWLFASGVDSTGVKVEVYTENHPTMPDGSISASPVGMPYTTKMTDPAYPQDTSWSSKCPNGCQFRQFTIANVPTETPLVIKTSDATGTNMWATVYDYNIYFSNSDVSTGDGGVPTVSYLATAAAADDLGVVAGTLGSTIDSSKGLLAGEVHDCTNSGSGAGDVRTLGATVGTTVQAEGGLFYFTSDEGNPLPDKTAHVTSELGLFGGVNVPVGAPVRVTAMGKDPANAGKFLMLGTYVVQMYPGAVTALALRGRRPWQP